MGILISHLFASFLECEKEHKLLMLGLDAAGKTTILNRLNLGEISTTVPTIGFNIETVKYKQITFSAWDLDGQSLIRKWWSHYYKGTSAVIFVVDSNDTNRFELAKKEVDAITQAPELENVPLLVFANKQDLCRRQQ